MNAVTAREQFAAARKEGKRAREAAHAIGLSEGGAIAAHGGEHEYPLKSVPLRGPWIEVLQALELCGPLMALTRNESTVHEKKGVYEKLSGQGAMGLALGEAIDLRMFFSQWHAGFGVTEAAANPGNPPSLSLQFFDAHGTAIHKIFAIEGTDRDALQSVIDQYAEPSLGHLFKAGTAPREIARPDAEIDAGGFSQGWGDMKDTHDFFGLLKKFGVERQQGFRLTEGKYTRRTSKAALRELLHEASFDGTPIMVFVGSPGCIQIHTGPVKRIEPMEMKGARWLNVLDADFNLHLREDMIDQVWIVEKPTTDGIVTSVEAFDSEGGLMAMFFGARKPGLPEKQEWRAIVSKLGAAEAAETAAA
ncbi:MAG: ChuX/HutX family heme-like substrate-binding protein [Burkholderiaceae bacterium]